MKPLKVLILSIVVIVIGFFVYGVRHHMAFCPVCMAKPLNPETVRHFIKGFGAWAIIIYILLYIANTFTPFFPPIFIMSLSAGALFGPVWGTAALTLGTFSGTTAAFFAARYLGRSRIEKFLQGKGTKLDKKLGENGFFILLPIRLIGFPPYGIIDFICGLSKMKYRDFVMATMIGASPWIITQVLLADRFARFNPKDPVLWGLLIGFVAMIVITGKVVKKQQQEKGDDVISPIKQEQRR